MTSAMAVPAERAAVDRSERASSRGIDIITEASSQPQSPRRSDAAIQSGRWHPERCRTRRQLCIDGRRGAWFTASAAKHIAAAAASGRCGRRPTSIAIIVVIALAVDDAGAIISPSGDAAVAPVAAAAAVKNLLYRSLDTRLYAVEKRQRQ